jgi:glycosyltransferase involved in cell wall biosynthesis
MSRIIIVINNNLAFDSRVRRQVKAFSEEFDEVVIYASPSPDQVSHYERENVRWHFFEDVAPMTNESLRDLCMSLGLYERIACLVPLILDDDNYQPENMLLHEKLQSLIMGADRWARVRAGIPMTVEPIDEISWMLAPLSRFLLWADAVSKIPADAIYCNDADTLLCGVVHKQRFQSRFLYDQHDILPDNAAGLYPRRYRYMVAALEYEFIKEADALIGIGWALLEWVRSTYSLRIPSFVIPNCKELQLSDSIKGHEIHKKGSKKIRLYYHGILRNGVETVLAATAKRDRFVIHLRCLPSQYLDEMKERVQSEGLQDKVVFLELVSPEMAAHGAFEDGDVGFFIPIGQSIGSSVALTNKFIEYLNAGLPIITSSICLDQSQILQDYNAGFVIDEVTEDSIGMVLDEIASNPEKLRAMSENALRASRELFDWNHYRALLVAVAKGEVAFEAPPVTATMLEDELKSVRQELAIWQSVNVCLLEDRADVQRKIRELQADKQNHLAEMEALRQSYHAIEIECANLRERPRLRHTVHQILRNTIKRARNTDSHKKDRDI